MAQQFEQGFGLSRRSMRSAIYNHYKAGHGYKGAQAASKFFFLNVLSLLEVLSLTRNK